MHRNYRVGVDESGQKEVVWSNTFLAQPTLKDVMRAAEEHFPGVPPDRLGVLSIMMTLIIKEGHSIRGAGVGKF